MASLNVVGNITTSGLSVFNINSNVNSLSSYSFLNISGTNNNLNNISTYSALNISTLTIISNNKQDTYTPEREYPPKLYNTVSLETTTTLLSKTVFTQTMTLDTSGIIYGSGDYIIYSSSQWTSSPGITPSLVRSLLFDYTDDIYGAHWQNSYYTPNGVYNNTNFIKK
jgi:hypothetical protein